MKNTLCVKKFCIFTAPVSKICDAILNRLIIADIEYKCIKKWFGRKVTIKRDRIEMA